VKTSETVLLAMLVFWSVTTSAQEEIRFIDGSLAAIMSIAKEKNKNVFIDTYADWCVPCKRMERKFKNKDVAMFFNEHFINYRVNMQNPKRAADLRRKYDVVFLPTMYILDPDGVIKYQVDKELTVSELLNAGQASLDPNSYFVSDATAVRRKDGTITGGRRPKIAKPKTKKNPKSVDIVKVDPQKVKINPKKPIDTAMGNVSISEATRRAKILESYETVEGSSQKILAVLGEGELPPEVLRQEAYLRLEFMDGSSKSAATNYLATQSDWSTEENRKFIMDFISSTFSKEYQYLCEHKMDFVAQFGDAKVKRTLEVLTYRTLHNAVPRPSLKEAINLYDNLDSENSEKQATHYFVNSLIADGNTKEVFKTSEEYLSKNINDHEMMYTVARYISTKTLRKDNEMKKATSLLKTASEINPNSLFYLELLALLYNDQGNTKKAKDTFESAMKLAKEKGEDYKKYEAKIIAVEG
jgi:tetratricopeptide (TPR) repeat protein